MQKIKLRFLTPFGMTGTFVFWGGGWWRLRRHQPPPSLKISNALSFRPKGEISKDLSDSTDLLTYFLNNLITQ